MTDLEDRFEFGEECKEGLIKAARQAEATCYSGGYAARIREDGRDEIIVYRVEEVRDL